MIKTKIEFLRAEEEVLTAYINKQFEAGKAIEVYQDALDKLHEVRDLIELEMLKPVAEQKQKMSRMELLIDKCDRIYVVREEELDYIAENISTAEDDWHTCSVATITKAMRASKIPTGVYWSDYAAKHKYKPQNVFPAIVWEDVYEAYKILF